MVECYRARNLVGRPDWQLTVPREHSMVQDDANCPNPGANHLGLSAWLRYLPRTMVAFFNRTTLSFLAGALGWLIVATASPAFAGTSDTSSASGDAASEPVDQAPADAGTGDGDQDGDQAATEKAPARRTKSDSTAAKNTSHQGQFHVRINMVGTYRIVMRYDNSPLCAANDGTKDDQKFCGFSAPLGLETAVGYAPLPGVEPFLFGRFGLGKETETQTAPLLVFGAGVRLYTMSDAPFKFFIEPAIGVELEKIASGATYNAGKDYAQDWLLRLAVGPQYDFNRYFGIYVAGSMTVGVVRALHSFMDLHGGLQVRFP